nr:MAG TPA: hypothetical protein [Caudoviricetes sp.]
MKAEDNLHKGLCLIPYQLVRGAREGTSYFYQKVSPILFVK